MTKESWKTAREIAAVTAAGSLEGAGIGFVLGTGFLSLPGAAAGGIIGGLTALSAELAGRRFTKDISVSYTLLADRAPQADAPDIEAKTVVFEDVPWPKRGDTVLSVLKELPGKIMKSPKIRSVRMEIAESKTSKLGALEVEGTYYTVSFPPSL